MPLSEHEQRILEEIERRLAEEDPRLVDQVSRTSLYTHLARRIKLAVLAFIAGFVMLMLFWVSVALAVAGFVLMLGSAALVYRYLKRIGREHLRAGPPAGGPFTAVKFDHREQEACQARSRAVQHPLLARW
jgi:hypothetical protein